VQPPGGVDEDDIGLVLGGGLHGVEGDRGGVGHVLVGADRRHPDALAPGLQLVGGGGAEGVGRAEDDILVHRDEDPGELADGRRLPGTVDPDDEDDCGPVPDPVGDHSAVHRGVDQGEQLFAEPHADGGLVPGRLHGDPTAQRLDQGGRRLDTEVGREEGLLDLLPCLVVQMTAREHGEQALPERGA